MGSSLTARVDELSAAYEWVRQGDSYALEITVRRPKSIVNTYLLKVNFPHQPLVGREELEDMEPTQPVAMSREAPDATLLIERKIGEGLYEPRYEATFLNRQFQRGSNLGKRGKVYTTSHKFMARVRSEMGITYEQFKALFTNSNLPETHKGAVSELIQ